MAGTPALRLATANLLRLGEKALRDAELLARDGSPQGSLLLARSALQHLALVLAASEHGWPLEEWETNLETLSAESPLQAHLATISDLLGPPPTSSGIDEDGKALAGPAVPALRKALDHMRDAIDLAQAAFGIDLQGSKPARAVFAVRPEPPPPPTAAKASEVTTPKSAKASATVPEAAQQKQPAQSSTGFWDLMDRWKVEDLAALALIGHPGGLTKAGTRPRFRLKGTEAEILGYLREIDASLGMMGAKPDNWMQTVIKATPFGGKTPLAHITRRSVGGARDVVHKIMEESLRTAG